MLTKRRGALRTFLLGSFALLAIFYGLVFVLEIPIKDVAILFAASSVMVMGLAVAGLVVAFLVQMVKRLAANIKTRK